MKRRTRVPDIGDRTLVTSDPRISIDGDKLEIKISKLRQDELFALLKVGIICPEYVSHNLKILDKLSDYDREDYLINIDNVNLIGKCIKAKVPKDLLSLSKNKLMDQGNQKALVKTLLKMFEEMCDDIAKADYQVAYALLELAKSSFKEVPYEITKTLFESKTIDLQSKRHVLQSVCENDSIDQETVELLVYFVQLNHTMEFSCNNMGRTLALNKSVKGNELLKLLNLGINITSERIKKEKFDDNFVIACMAHKYEPLLQALASNENIKDDFLEILTRDMSQEVRKAAENTLDKKHIPTLSMND